MRAAVFIKPGQKLELQDIPVPDPNAGEVLLKIHRCGICGTDLHMTEAHTANPIPTGFVLGHERSAVVEAVGRDVEHLKPGDHVVPHPTKGCGRCASCQAGSPYFCERGADYNFGGFAEYMVTPAFTCALLPATLSLDDASIIEPLAVGLMGIRKNPFPMGTKVLVLGAGPIGIAAAFWARQAGAGKLAMVATSRTREAIGLTVGVDRFFIEGEGLAEELHGFFDGAPDLVIDCAGAVGSLTRAVEIVRPQGSVTVLGICEHQDQWVPALAVIKEVKLQFGVGTWLSEFRHAADTLDRGIVSPLAMITDIVSFNALPDMFETLKQRNNQCKVILDPNI